mmetsp:Transcript_27845/g.55671  ORF Transcript_27845/g.55671 Transcript_27845/m.55671 type:complete len:103 (-) Transcript_27845:96-404(-)
MIPILRQNLSRRKESLKEENEAPDVAEEGSGRSNESLVLGTEFGVAGAAEPAGDAAEVGGCDVYGVAEDIENVVEVGAYSGGGGCGLSFGFYFCESRHGLGV